MPEKNIPEEPQAKRHTRKKPRPAGGGVKKSPEAAKPETETNESGVEERQEVDALQANGEVANATAANGSLKKTAADKRAVKKLAKDTKAAAAAVTVMETAEVAAAATAAAAAAAAQIPSVVRELQEEIDFRALLAVRSGSGSASGGGSGSASGGGSGSASGSGSGIGAGTVTESGSGSGNENRRPPSLVMACFSAKWCRPCQVFAPKLELIARRYNRVAFVKLNVDKLPEVADKYQVRAVPTFVLFKGGIQVGSVSAASQAKLELLLASNGAVPLDDNETALT